MKQARNKYLAGSVNSTSERVPTNFARNFMSTYFSQLFDASADMKVSLHGAAMATTQKFFTRFSPTWDPRTSNQLRKQSTIFSEMFLRGKLSTVNGRRIRLIIFPFRELLTFSHAQCLIIMKYFEYKMYRSIINVLQFFLSFA